jgi:lipopolysaccharide transport system ATP-binding protein
MGNIAVKVDDVWKQYRKGRAKAGTLRESMSGLFKKQSEEDIFWALKEISFEVKHGEAVGIIGRNGAGKSTLLKILSSITYPTKGRVDLYGRVASLLEVGTGFHPELTGRENVFLNGTILGMTRSEVKTKFEEIVAFSGVEGFIDTPIKHYSSGMKVRLAFSVAAHLDPEILIIDEVLAVGDAEFQRKCLGKMGEVAGEGRTVLFVSHNMAAMQRLCSAGILLESSTIECYGEIGNVIETYRTIGQPSENGMVREFEYSDETKPLSFLRVEIITKNEGGRLITGDTLVVKINYRASEKSHSFINCHFSIAITDSNDQIVVHHSTRTQGLGLSHAQIVKGSEIFIVIDELRLRPGRYAVSLNAVQLPEFLDFRSNVLSFDLEPSSKPELVSYFHSGIFIPKAVWSVSEV